MHAIVLAGGKGTRLLPYTSDRPKALVDMGDRAMVEVLVGQLRDAGAKRITLCVAHLGEMIRERLADGERHQVRIDYTTETRPLGTAGPLALVEEWTQPALVVNADILTTIDFAAMYRYHCDNAAVFTVATYEHRLPVPFGVLDVVDGRVAALREKPEVPVEVAAGVYVADPGVRDHIPAGDPVDMPHLVDRLVAAGATVNAYQFWGDWHDIGDPAAYQRAERRFRENPQLFLARTGTEETEDADRKAAATMDLTPAQLSEIIAKEMGSVLMCPPLQPSDDFFLSGGDSLRAVELISRLVARWYPVDGESADRLRNALLLAIFDDSTPRFLADVISEQA